MKECEYADYHYNLDDCETCPKCGYENHRYTLEPYCDWCGKPHEQYFGKIKQMLDFKGKKRR